MRCRTSITFLFSLWLSIASYLPSIYLFTDTLLLPKWYLCIVGVACAGAIVGVTMLRRKPLPKMSDAFPISVAVFTVVTIAECLYVGGCVLTGGWKTGGECGTFDTPAGLALSLCIAIPLAVHQTLHADKRSSRLLYGAATLLFVATLLLTRSRTGMICLALYGIIYLTRMLKQHILNQRIRNSLLIGVSAILLTGTLFFVSSHKTASTSGRAFILQRSMELIMEHPFVGHGHGSFEREYMLRQARFFKVHPNDVHTDLADDMHHPLNEFIYLWINYGFVAPVALLTALMLPLLRLRHHLLLQLTVLALLVFSCFSYPFHYPIAWLIAGGTLLYTFWKSVLRWSSHVAFPCVLLLASVVTFALTLNDAVHEHLWYRAYRHSFRHKSALAEYEQVHSYFRQNPYFLYNYAIASFMHKDLDRAEHLLGECARFRNSYNQELLHGDVCLRRENYTEAIVHYQTASHMCPVRFAPLEGLCKVYQATGDEVRRKEMATRIANKKVKVNSSAVQRIKRQYQ